ncbi:hypothetical protein ABEB36_013950 [Hypothenemus hampei]|uniref:Uncharacterized protein n=1 Tax=Hypothenemus hampei TaxID=57062 RepID=A0ABD1E8H4_HYPHA
MFKISVGEGVVDKGCGNVLQGYYGPYNNGDSGDSGYLGASNGLQEVKYKWGATKHMNWVPVSGWIAFGICRAIGDTSWNSLYFDRQQLFDNGKFSEAEEYFNNAYTHSSYTKNYDVYKSNRENAKAEIDAINLNSEGDDLFNEGKYHEAHSKYHEAFDKSNVSRQYKIYSTNLKKAKVEIDAINLNSKGDGLFNQGKYRKAHSKYHEAYDKSNVSRQYKIYSTNRDKAKAEIDAINLNSKAMIYLTKASIMKLTANIMKHLINLMLVDSIKYIALISRKPKVEIDAINLNSKGDGLFNQGKYRKAHSKYHEAYDKSNVSRQYKIYSTNRDKAKAEIDAINLNSEGDGLFNQGKYREAHSKYHEAYDKSNVSDGLFNQGKYREAHSKYHEAYDKSNVSRQYKIYSTNRDKAKAEIDAINLNSEGDGLFNQGKYREAHSKYHEAYDKSNVSRQHNIYSTNRDKAKAEIDAINLNSEGDGLFNQGKYREAHNSIINIALTETKPKVELDALNAYQRGETLFNKRRYSDALKEYQAAHIQVEIIAEQLYEQGEVLYCTGKYVEAKTKYNEAVHTSKVHKDYYSSLGVVKAQTELDAIALNDRADVLLSQGKFAEAIKKYQAAYDKTQVFNQREQYKNNRDSIQAKVYNQEGYKLLSEATAERDFALKILKYKNAQEKFEKGYK